MVENRVFGAPWSTTVKAITYGTIVLILAACGPIVWKGIEQLGSDAAGGWALIGIGIVCSLSIFLTVLWAPRGYRIGGSAIYIRRPIGEIEVPFSEIDHISIMDFRDVFRGAMRVGSGGFFGVFGRFYGGELRAFRAYVTNNGPMVVTHMKQGMPIVISPDDPREFVRMTTELSGVPLQE